MLRINEWRIGKVRFSSPESGLVVIDARPRWWLPFSRVKVESSVQAILMEHLRAGVTAVGMLYVTKRMQKHNIEFEKCHRLVGRPL